MENKREGLTVAAPGFALCFGLVFACQVGCAQLAPWWERTNEVLVLLFIAGVGWWGAVSQAMRGKGSMVLVVLGALLLRGAGLSSWPDVSDDIHRYVWEGQLVLEGVSPYAFAPDSASLESLRAANPEVFDAMNNKGVSAAYPPVTQAACAMVVGLAKWLEVSPLFSLRVFFALCDLLVLWPLCVLLRRLAQPLSLCVLWAWSPLVVLEFSGSGHFDSLGILLLVSALAIFTSAGEGKKWLGVPVWSGAVLVKYLPLVALPFLLRKSGGPLSLRTPGGLPRALLGLGLIAFAFLPLHWMLGGFDGLFRGMGAYGLKWQSSGLIHPFVAELVEMGFERDGSWFDARRVARGLLGLCWLGVGFTVWRRKLDLVHSTGCLIAAFLLLSPTLHPWYVTWLVPFVALRPKRSWMWLMLAIPGYYEILTRWHSEGVWEQDLAMRAIVAVPFAMLWTLEFRRERPLRITP